MFYLHTGRIPEGHRKGTELPLRYSRNASGTLPLSSGNMSCRLISWHIGGHFQKVVLVGCLARPPTASHGQACPWHWLVRAHSKDSVWKKYQKTRIPEGYRKGTGRVTELPLRGSRNQIATLPAYRKETGRAPEGHRKGNEKDRSRE